MTAVRPSTRVAAAATARPAPAERRTPARPRLRLVARRRQAGHPLSVAASVLVSLVFAAVLGIVVLQALLVQSQSRLDDVQEQLVVEQRRSDRLRLDLVQLRSPERIVSDARERLGLIVPEEVLYLQHESSHDGLAALAPEAATAPEAASGAAPSEPDDGG